MIKRVLGLFLSILFISFFGSCQGSRDDDQISNESTKENTVKVLTYNIWGAQPGGIKDLQAIADVINKIKPDLVALQEVDRFTTRNATHGDMAKKLGELTGMDYFFAKAENFWGGEYGDAVLSRLPILEKKDFPLRVDPHVDPALGGENRVIARIKVKKNRKDFYFLSTHFDHIGDQRNRLKNAMDLVKWAKSFDLPVIGGGDLNARPESETMRIIQEFFTLGCLDGNCTQSTVPGANLVIDYLFHAPKNAFTRKIYSVYTAADRESDHFPVLAVYEIN